MSERYVLGDITPEAARKLAPILAQQLEALADDLEDAADKRGALFDYDGEILDLGYSEGLRDAAQRLRETLKETPNE